MPDFFNGPWYKMMVDRESRIVTLKIVPFDATITMPADSFITFATEVLDIIRQLEDKKPD